MSMLAMGRKGEHSLLDTVVPRDGLDGGMLGRDMALRRTLQCDRLLQWHLVDGAVVLFEKAIERVAVGLGCIYKGSFMYCVTTLRTKGVNYTKVTNVTRSDMGQKGA